jgi:CBS domain-containing protein
MTVTELMRQDVVTAVPAETADVLARRMRDEDVGSVVVETDGRPAGIVTDRDLAVGPLAEGREPTAVTAEEVMTADPVTVTADTGVMELCDRISEASVRRMPVVDRDGRLTGIVTLDDLHVLLTEEQSDLAAVVRAESPPY